MRVSVAVKNRTRKRSDFGPEPLFGEQEGGKGKIERYDAPVPAQAGPAGEIPEIRAKDWTEDQRQQVHDGCRIIAVVTEPRLRSPNVGRLMGVESYTRQLAKGQKNESR